VATAEQAYFMIAGEQQALLRNHAGAGVAYQVADGRLPLRLRPAVGRGGAPHVPLHAAGRAADDTPHRTPSTRPNSLAGVRGGAWRRLHRGLVARLGSGRGSDAAAATFFRAYSFGDNTGVTYSATGILSPATEIDEGGARCPPPLPPSSSSSGGSEGGRRSRP